MSYPAKVTDSDSFFSRFPPHTEHSVLTRNRATRRFISGLWVLANVSIT